MRFTEKDRKRITENTMNAIADAIDAIDGEPEDQKLAIQRLIMAVAWLGDRVLALELEDPNPRLSVQSARLEE